MNLSRAEPAGSGGVLDDPPCAIASWRRLKLASVHRHRGSRPMSEGGTLVAIWVKRAHRGPMDRADRVELEMGRGIVGNADQGSRRQITLLDGAEWERRVASLHPSLDPGVRRANLLVRGISLRDSRTRVLRVGPCRIRILGETKPCYRMDEAHPGLKDALYADWGGGAFGEVLDGGEIAVGDAVDWTESG